MQKSARCSRLWRFKYSPTCPFHVRNLHSSMLSTEKTQVQPSTLEQEWSNGGIEDNYQHTEQLRQRNCWKLWYFRRLSVEEISCILHMRHDTIINIILSFERKRGSVDWVRLCNLVMLTTSTAQAILVARSKAKREISSSRGAALFSASDIKNLCPQNVTHSHIYLVHMMLWQKLTSAEIFNLARFTDLDSKGTHQAEATDSDLQWTHQTENIADARARNTAFPEYNGKMKYASREESVDFVNPISIVRRNNKVTESACVAVHKEYADIFLNTSLGANGRRPASKLCQEEKHTAAFRNMVYDSEGGKNLGFHLQVPVLQEGKLSSLDAEGREVTDSGSVTAVAEQKLVTMFDILRWLQNNHMATISDVVNAFGYCEAKHLLFLLLEMLESSIIVEQEGMLIIASEQSSSRWEKPTSTSQALFSSSINKRMHRALCLKAVILNVVIHEPKKNVEFVIRHVKADDESSVYHVQICKHPSCTCPDFSAGLDYMPCKHLLYVHLVQLRLEKDYEHLMLQRTLKEEDLEKILEGYY